MRDAIQIARTVLAATRADLLRRPNVVATGVGLKRSAGGSDATPCIVCSVAEKLGASNLSLRARIPDQLDGVPTDVVQTGRLRALAARTDRQRPAPGGVSIGHRAVTAGTLGCLLEKDGARLILSNNHVLANSNDARPGDPILQPGVLDGGRHPEDHLADLAAFAPIHFIGAPSRWSLARATAEIANRLARLFGSRARLRATSDRLVENLVDAALARPLRDADVSDEILEIGSIVDLASAELGMGIQKSGRTTALTRGEILQVDVTADVEYGGGRVARFADQLLAGPMSQGGDSGSAVLDDYGRLVGLLFAGSENTTVINRIENVLVALGFGS
ncbi:MAG: S1 family peptidase [Myxococcales bacterium]|nr:S1 family peptidase [Myxococcales bacterium]MDH5307861.1 S1 family peptidase [Myxococcales bacterium]MDH5566589.1 S1 family peptidase [Myxococcales bacterium]